MADAGTPGPVGPEGTPKEESACLAEGHTGASDVPCQRRCHRRRRLSPPNRLVRCRRRGMRYHTTYPKDGAAMRCDAGAPLMGTRPDALWWRLVIQVGSALYYSSLPETDLSLAVGLPRPLDSTPPLLFGAGGWGFEMCVLARSTLILMSCEIPW